MDAFLHIVDGKTLDLKNMDPILDEWCKAWTDFGRKMQYIDEYLDAYCNTWTKTWTHIVLHGR